MNVFPLRAVLYIIMCNIVCKRYVQPSRLAGNFRIQIGKSLQLYNINNCMLCMHTGLAFRILVIVYLLFHLLRAHAQPSFTINGILGARCVSACARASNEEEWTEKR